MGVFAVLCLQQERGVYSDLGIAAEPLASDAVYNSEDVTTATCNYSLCDFSELHPITTHTPGAKGKKNN